MKLTTTGFPDCRSERRRTGFPCWSTSSTSGTSTRAEESGGVDAEAAPGPWHGGASSPRADPARARIASGAARSAESRDMDGSTPVYEGPAAGATWDAWLRGPSTRIPR